MNQNGTVVFSTVHSAALTHSVSNQTLREGSVVLVRVLKNLGGNTYTISYLGKRFLLQSEIALKEGETFQAKIKLSGKNIILSPQKENTPHVSLPEKGSPLFDKNGKVLNVAFASYLENLKLIPDETSYILLNQIRLLGMKFDPHLIKKMRLVARNSKSGEKNAAETALVLEKKGITADSKTIEAITNCGEKSDENEGHSFKNNTAKITILSDTEDSLEKNIKIALETYIHALIGNDQANNSPDNSQEIQKNGEAQKETNQNGILALFNHRGFDVKSPLFFGSWIKIPFELERPEFEKQKKAKISGFISLFLHPLKKTTEKCIVKGNYNDKLYAFSLSFKNGKCIKIRSNLTAEKIGEIPVEKCDVQHITDFEADYGDIILEDV
ncbi:MAG: hypothetical protein HDR52_08205 [Treponema sp.]|nr:hypothetical protein [Treponema sp.]